MTRNAKSGVDHFVAPDDEACLALIRDLLGYMPGNKLDDAPRGADTHPADREDPGLDDLVPEPPNQPYDIAPPSPSFVISSRVTGCNIAA